MKVIRPLFFFFRNYDHNYNKIYIHHRYINSKVENIFPYISLIINTLLPPLHETLYAGHTKFFAEISELFQHAVFQLNVVCKRACLESILQVTKQT